MDRRISRAVALAAALASGVPVVEARAAALRPSFSNPATGSLFAATSQGLAFLESQDPGLASPRAALSSSRPSRR